MDGWLEIFECMDVSASNKIEVEVEARFGNTQKYFFGGVGGWVGRMGKLGLKLPQSKLRLSLAITYIQFRCSLDFFHYLHGWVGGWDIGE